MRILILKPQHFIFLVIFLIPSYLAAEGRQEVGKWTVRWSDADSNGAYAHIIKSEWLDDMPGKTMITISISQNIHNIVGINTVYEAENTSGSCSDSESFKEATIDINRQPVRFLLDIVESSDCEVKYSWLASSEKGAKYLRKAFNSGIVIFEHVFFDHIFDTRDHIPAYNLMKRMVESEIEKAKIAF